MQVILDCLFACPGSAPIGGRTKGEFKDWTRPGRESLSTAKQGRKSAMALSG